MVDQDGQQDHWDKEELHSEGVMVSIIGGLELAIDEVDGGICTHDVNDLRAEHTGDTEKRAAQEKQMCAIQQYSCLFKNWGCS